MDHPADSTLLHYCDDNISEEALASIEEHLSECGDCARKVVQIVRESMGSVQR